MRRATRWLMVGVWVVSVVSVVRAQANPDAAADLAKAREAYTAATAKANEALLAKHAQKQWDAVKAQVADAEAKAKAGDAKAAAALYQQAAKAAKDAIDLANYAEASQAASAAADAKTAKEYFTKAQPFIAALEKETDLYAGRALIVALEDLIPRDPRMAGWRSKVSAMPVPKQTTIPIGRINVPLKLVQIPAGTFTMGSPDDEKGRSRDEGPQREVTFSKPFYISVGEITRGQWEAPRAERPSPGDLSGPIVDITREEAVNFCKSVCDPRTKRIVRLPTEAEWEYACRAGSKTRFSFGDADAALDEHAWHFGNAGGAVHKGGEKKPNAFGLFDMHGNVWEWCSDLYADAYPAGAAADPQGPAAGLSFIARGGSWRCTSRIHRSAYRYIVPPNFHCDDIGFRVVVTWGDDKDPAPK